MELHDVEESMAIRKILAHDIRMKKNHKPRRTLSGSWIFMELCGPKVQLHPRTETSSMASLTPKSSICCYVFKCFLFTDLKKNTLALTENLNFNGTYIGQKQPFERILKNGCSE